MPENSTWPCFVMPACGSPFGFAVAMACFGAVPKDASSGLLRSTALALGFTGAGRAVDLLAGGGGDALSKENGIAASGAETSAAEFELALALAGAASTSWTALRRSA